jgi:predicted amidophosphoribosyltransferase
MKCSGCGHENRETAKFCEECAAPVGRKCAGCGAELRPIAKFCDACAWPISGVPPPRSPDPRSYTPKHLVERILTSRSAIEGERKQVTILFADVRGSTELASVLDPEEWHGIMDRFF